MSGHLHVFWILMSIAFDPRSRVLHDFGHVPCIAWEKNPGSPWGIHQIDQIYHGEFTTINGYNHGSSFFMPWRKQMWKSGFSGNHGNHGNHDEWEKKGWRNCWWLDSWLIGWLVSWFQDWRTGKPQINQGVLDAKMVIHDLDDWGSPFLGNPKKWPAEILWNVDDQWDATKGKLCRRMLQKKHANMRAYRQTKAVPSGSSRF